MKRFYREAAALAGEAGWQIALDGRAVRTQGGQPLILPGQSLAAMLAGEWAAQGEIIDPANFRCRDLADYAIDVVRPNRTAAIAALLQYAETDTLCYRADPDEPLWRRQQEVWEPILTACEAREGVRFQRVSGVIHRAQDTATLAALRARLERFDDFTLAALTTLAALSASLTIALAALEPDADGEALWAAANLEEEWQTGLWGDDPEAAGRRARRRNDFLSAMAFARAADEAA